MTDRTAELVAERELAPEEIAAALAELGLAVRAADADTIERVYLDTFDGLLHAEGLTLRWQRGQLELLPAGRGDIPFAAAACPDPAGPLPVAQLSPGPLRDALHPVIDVRALLALARVRVHSTPLAVLDALDKTVARLAVETPALVSGSGREALLRPRLRLAGVRGYERELALVRDRLSGALGLEPAGATLADEAVRAAGGRPEGTGAKVDVALDANERADAAAAAVLSRMLEIADDNLPGTIADTDSEFLHDYRVSVRRSRAVLRELKGVFPPGELGELRAELRWLQQVTGPSRDLDVYVLEFDATRALVPGEERAELEPLRAVLGGRRLVARRQMVQELRSPRAVGARARWGSMLERLVALPGEDRPDATAPIGELAAARIRRVYRRMVRMGRAIGPDSPAEEYHELRKQGKELRYLLELLGVPLFDAGVVKPMIRALKGLQDVLGRHQDREVQTATLRALADEVSALPGGPACLIAMGVLVDRLERDAAAARAEFADAFASFASAEQRARVRKAFGA